MEKIELFKYCRRCGRKLKSFEAQQLGYGPVCWSKLQNSKERQPLFIQDVLKDERGE